MVQLNYALNLLVYHPYELASSPLAFANEKSFRKCSELTKGFWWDCQYYNPSTDKPRWYSEDELQKIHISYVQAIS